jgi:RNA polymerase sigma-70 factor (ECF subfamily)
MGESVPAKRVRAELQEAMRRGYVAAFRLLRNADESREACQEAAARALAAGDRYNPDKPFYPWFHRILKNHCLDRLARRKRLVLSDEEPRGAAVHPPAARSDAEHRVLSDERSRAVAAAIASLDDDLRQVIELRHFQDASYEEIAAIVGCPIGTVMSRLYRARKALRAKLQRNPAFAGSKGGSR